MVTLICENENVTSHSEIEIQISGGVWTVFSGCCLRSATPESAAAFIPAPIRRLNPTGNYHAQPRPVPVRITGVGLSRLLSAPETSSSSSRSPRVPWTWKEGATKAVGGKMAGQLTLTRDWSVGPSSRLGGLVQRRGDGSHRQDTAGCVCL